MPWLSPRGRVAGLLALAVLILDRVETVGDLAAGFALLVLFAVVARGAFALLENLRLQDSTRLAGTDELTGLPNRRVFDLRLAKSSRAATSSPWPSSTSTASRSSTTRSATAPATSCSPRSAPGCRRPSARTG